MRCGARRDAFVAEAKKAVVELYGTEPKNNPDYSRVISPREVSRLAGLIDPLKVVSGGKSDAEARYLDPTIVCPVTWDDHLFIESMPFGGTGQSGMGHYYGKHGFDSLTHAKSMLISPPDSAIGHLFPPYTDTKNEELTQWLDY